MEDLAVLAVLGPSAPAGAVAARSVPCAPCELRIVDEREDRRRLAVLAVFAGEPWGAGAFLLSGLTMPCQEVLFVKPLSLTAATAGARLVADLS
mmetsp:Transcript_124550/g.202567  ORF Transcript_124550/g.202567 Transcript_124550/m.202567 type:complete len:94 (-) Transcript_124550:115-396(-)